ncbi:hypothetical protein BH11CYA1_BH11CYA1_28140 [soil metagenome]
MIQDIIRALIQKVMGDKILMGLIAISIIAIFFNGANQSEKKESVQSKRLGRASADQPLHPYEDDAQGQNQQAAQPAQVQAGTNQAANQPGVQASNQAAGQMAGQANAGQAAAVQATGAQQAGGGLTPQLASDFIHWWIERALDYRMASCAASQKEAKTWMLPDAANAFEQLYWGEHIKQGIASGSLVGSFQPVSITPVATNPDGTMVVTVVGTLVMQQTGQQPAGQQLTMDFLVKKDGDGCRIAGFFNRAVAPVAAP